MRCVEYVDIKIINKKVDRFKFGCPVTHFYYEYEAKILLEKLGMNVNIVILIAGRIHSQ